MMKLFPSQAVCALYANCGLTRENFTFFLSICVSFYVRRIYENRFFIHKSATYGSFENPRECFLERLVRKTRRERITHSRAAVAFRRGNHYFCDAGHLAADEREDAVKTQSSQVQPDQPQGDRIITVIFLRHFMDEVPVNGCVNFT
jgi:hypothetical protein